MTDRRAWGWVEHLRQGGTTPWADWTGTAEPGGAVVPGAQQLELVRRLNRAGSPAPRLVERVLSAGAPGRGQPDLELVGATPESRFGPRPVDPVTVPDDELLRLAVGILAEDVTTRGVPAPPRKGRPRPWRRHYALHGDPELAAPLRADLVARGRPPGGGDPVHVILATDLGRMLAHVWTARAFGSGIPAWRGWLRTVERHGSLPPPIDPLVTARTRTGDARPDRIHIVLDHEALPSLLGVRRLPEPQPEPAAEVPDLARRISRVLGLLVPDHQRKALMRRRVRPLLGEEPGTPLSVPEEHHGWLRDHAARITDGLSRAGYAVHGDPAMLAPVREQGVEAPAPRSTLALAIRMMLAAERADMTDEEA